MPLLDQHKSHLLLVDFQTRLMPAIHDGARAVANAVRLAMAAERLSVPILRTEQYPAGLGPTVADLAVFGPVVEKTAFGSCREPAFLAAVSGPQTLVVAGCEAHVCVLQTVVGLLEAGRRVAVVEDAIGARAPASVSAAIRRMRRYGAEIVTTEMVVFEWLGRSDRPEFRAVSALIK